MGRIVNSSPTDPTDRFVQQIRALQQQVAELQRPAPTAAWTSYTPTLVNINKGTTGSIVAAYSKHGRTVFGSVAIDLGGSGVSVAGPATFTLPITGRASQPIRIGEVSFVDTGSRYFSGAVLMASTTTGLIAVDVVAGSYIAQDNISATAPHTWAATDAFYIKFAYEAAA